jgi:DNA-3-methyladenine glycosylase II
MEFTITPDAPFSLGGNQMRLAFVTDDMSHHAGVRLTQARDGAVTGHVETDGDAGAAWRQALRVLSLDHPAGEWPKVGARDPVIGRLQREHEGFRPVLFHSPYEAAAWSIISARRYRGQAVAIRDRLSAELGRTFTITGQQLHAFPLPHRLLKRESLRSVAPQRVEWLHAVARAALDGALDPATLRAMEPGRALKHLQQLPGIGPSYATLILVRAAGVADTLTFSEPRLPGYVAHFYGTGADPASREQLERVADGWRPFRTWAAVLLRLAGDQLGLPAAA